MTLLTGVQGNLISFAMDVGCQCYVRALGTVVARMLCTYSDWLHEVGSSILPVSVFCRGQPHFPILLV